MNEQSHFIEASDGLTLHAREWGGAGMCDTPLVCLPGLSRNTRDFNAVATFLSDPDGPATRVVAIDYRGRGGSGRDPEWQKYSLPVEQADILAVLDHLAIARADFLGTSRGGLHMMGLAGVRPGLIRKAILNDIGPVLEMEGLRHISTTVGFAEPEPDWASAAESLRARLTRSFPALDAEGWLRFARQLYRKRADGRLVLDYDPALGNTLRDIDFSQPFPPLWEAFAGLAGSAHSVESVGESSAKTDADASARVTSREQPGGGVAAGSPGTDAQAMAPGEARPVLVLRGALSDLLSAATVREMQSRHPHVEAMEIPDEGHAPLLWQRAVHERIAAFLAA